MLEFNEEHYLSTIYTMLSTMIKAEIQKKSEEKIHTNIEQHLFYRKN